MLDIAELFRGAGGGDDATLRLLAVYADSLRRIAKAEADYPLMTDALVEGGQLSI
jgi:hypothetical protein